jgi:hypothetical protein
MRRAFAGIHCLAENATFAVDLTSVASKDWHPPPSLRKRIQDDSEQGASWPEVSASQHEDAEQCAEKEDHATHVLEEPRIAKHEYTRQFQPRRPR